MEIVDIETCTFGGFSGNTNRSIVEVITYVDRLREGEVVEYVAGEKIFESYWLIMFNKFHKKYEK